MIIVNRPNKTKITEFGITGLINKDIGRFNISVNKTSRMKIVHSFGGLVKNILFMFIGEYVFPDESVQIDIHVFKY